MNKKLYVGNLSYDTTGEGLEGAFAQVAEVEAAVVVQDRETGRPRGFGFVTMATEEGAAEAIQRLDGSSLDGRDIKVNEANPPRARESRGNGSTRW